MLRRSLRQAQRRLRKNRIAALLAVLGPGVITAFGGNDASGIYGYSLAGAQYGYALLWAMVLVAFSLGVCQEMCARMGAVTGKGLADLIREEYGVKVTIFAMTALLLANFATTVSEFAGITAAVEIFAPSYARWIVVPLVALGVWLLVTRGSYRRVERVLLAASAVFITYLISAFLAHPPWAQVGKQLVIPGRLPLDRNYVVMVISLIGTTITPWAQFYVQASVRDKGVRAEQYTPADSLFGAFTAVLVACLIIICCAATIYRPGQMPDFSNAGEIARALEPAAGSWAKLLFAIGLFNACCFGAIVVPLSTAYAVTESLGWEGGLGRRVQEAPLFNGVFTFLIVAAALVVVLWGGRDLTAIITLPNLVGGMLLPVILILMLKLINNRRLMGEYVNSRFYNLIAWTTTSALVVLSVTLLVFALMPAPKPAVPPAQPAPRVAAELFDPTLAATLLEGPNRDRWQQPQRIVHTLRLHSGQRVADIGTGSGYLLPYLSRAVGKKGVVYAEEIQEAFLPHLRDRAKKLGNVQVVLGRPDDPKLPAKVDCLVLLTTYHEVQNPVAFLQTLRRYAKPGAQLAIIDFDPDRKGDPPPPANHSVREADVLAEAQQAGWKLEARYEFLPSQFFLVFR